METKTSQRTGIVESVAIDYSRIAAYAAKLSEGLMPSDRLLALFCSGSCLLGLDTGIWSPYSLRRSGATFDAGAMAKLTVRSFEDDGHLHAALGPIYRRRLPRSPRSI